MDAPLQFKPLFREYIWGARRLGEVLGKPIGTAPRYAESWEIVDHGDEQSIVESGTYQGKTLAQLMQLDPQGLLGAQAVAEGRALAADGKSVGFPLLLKYLDCDRVLSVQVHPDDAYGRRMSPPDLGKTEAWYIMSAEPESVIYAGLQAGVGPKELRNACDAGRVDDVLHTLRPRAGDCVFIPAGTVHALGSGLLVAEIQQASNTTFRLFDWNRVDDNGNPRPLHVEQAIDVTNFDRGPVAFQSPEPLPDATTSRESSSTRGTGERLVGCDQFVLNRYQGGGSWRVGGNDRFQIITIVGGSARLIWQEDRELKLSLGQTVLLPAAMQPATLMADDPQSTLLVMHLP
ncbi:MAG: type I phosphomannose isomerase catalytic subunit [Pirellulaceae bacterium]